MYIITADVYRFNGEGTYYLSGSVSAHCASAENVLEVIVNEEESVQECAPAFIANIRVIKL